MELDNVSYPVRALTWNGTLYYISDEEQKYMKVESQVDPDTVHAGIDDNLIEMNRIKNQQGGHNERE